MNRAVDAGVGRAALEEAYEAFATVGEVLGLLEERTEAEGLVDGLVDLLIGLREDARGRKDFGAADRIREALAELGIVLEDTRDGVRWKRRERGP